MLIYRCLYVDWDAILVTPGAMAEEMVDEYYRLQELIALRAPGDSSSDLTSDEEPPGGE